MIFGIFYFITYVFVLLCLWKVIYSKTISTKMEKIFSSSLIALGLSTFILPMLPMGTITFFRILNTPSHADNLAYWFINYLFTIFYDIFAIMAGTFLSLTVNER